MLRFFHRLRVSQKLMLISVLFMIPDTVLLCLFLFSINTNIKFARWEKYGNEYQTALEELLELIPLHLLQAQVGSEASPGMDAKTIEGRIDTALTNLKEVDSRIGPLLQFTEEGLSKRKREHCTVRNLTAEWQQLKSNQAADGEAHLHLVSDVRTMITHAGDSSNLILDPDLDSYYLMDVTLLALPEMQDRLWKVAEDAISILRDQKLSKAECNQLAVHAALLTLSDLDRILGSTQTALTEDVNFYGRSESLQRRVPPALNEFRKKAEEFIGMVKGLSEREAANVTTAQFVASAMRVHAESFKLWQIAKVEVDVLLSARMHYYRMRRARSLVLTALALTAAVGLVSFITRSISRPLQKQAAELRLSNSALQEEIQERHRAETALKSAEQRYRSIFENSVEGIFQTTEDGHYLVANPTLARIYGYDTPEELQHSMTDIGSRLYVDPHRRAEFQHQIAAHGQIFGFESEIYHKNGSTLWISENARAVRDEKGALLYYEGTVEDITARKRNEAALQKAQSDLLNATRMAGMAEVATGILHNVGNVLNSVNVSANCITDTLRKSKVPHLTKAAALLKQNDARLAEYITADQKGKLLPGYIVDLSAHLVSEHEGLVQKMDQLKKHLEHVKEIVAMQQNYAKVGGVREKINVTELMEDALRLNAGGLARHRIEVVRDYDTAAAAALDKHKVLQILVNLVRNAEHACALSVKERKQLTVRVVSEREWIKVSVADNGIGIPEQNMMRIFKHGFTTKKDGHGFGLHSCALAAKELGGTLNAQSDGDGFGAVFTLELPMLPASA
jgi:PAS domain S-box-containing protein